MKISSKIIIIIVVAMIIGTFTQAEAQGVNLSLKTIQAEVISFQGEPWNEYELMSSTNLEVWRLVAPIHGNATGLYSYTNYSGQSKMFYRVRESSPNKVHFEFRSAAVSVTRGTMAGEYDVADFIIKFSAVATGDLDIYIDGDVNIWSVITTDTDRLTWSLTSDSTITFGSMPDGIILADDGYNTTQGDVNDLGDKRFIVRAGESRSFTFRVSISASGDNVSAGVQINSIQWDTISQDRMSNTYVLLGSGSMRTDTVTGLHNTYPRLAEEF